MRMKCYWPLQGKFFGLYAGPEYKIAPTVLHNKGGGVLLKDTPAG